MSYLEGSPVNDVNAGLIRLDSIRTVSRTPLGPVK